MEFEKILSDSDILLNIMKMLKMEGKDFAAALGYSQPQSVYNITNKSYGRRIPSLMRNKILTKYPVNWKYLDYGIEPILLSEQEAINQRNYLGLGQSKGVIQLTPEHSSPSEIESLKKEIYDLREENRSIKADIRDIKDALRELKK